MTESKDGAGNATSQAVRAVAEVAKLVVQPFSTFAQAYADDFRQRKLAITETEMRELKVRAQMNLEMEIVRHQINKEFILEKTEELLLAEEAQKELPPNTDAHQIDHDWLFKWADMAKEVSNDEIQWLWAKVLAGELKQPGKYSLRLLSILSSLRKSDAENFESFANYV